MTLKSDAKFGERLTSGLENDRRNLANFHQSKQSLKVGTFIGSFIQSRKCMSLKFTGELRLMTMKNDSKFEKELTRQFKIDMRNLINFDPST